MGEVRLAAVRAGLLPRVEGVREVEQCCGLARAPGRALPLPDGLARGMHRDFADFTFDHVVRGVIAAERGDSRQLFLIRAVDNVITTETLVAGDPWDW